MNILIKKHIEEVLHHLYINPLEMCNLHCRICYTRKTSPILSREQIEEFIGRYDKVYPLKTITFCGGEVFALPYFPAMVNALTGRGIFVQIITNGTIDTLNQYINANSVNLIVSIDGLREYHDKNRGAGNFDKSMAFLKKAQAQGFHTEIFSIVTTQNYEYLNVFEEFLQRKLGKNISVTYHPRKPPAYLLHHPVSNVVGSIEGFDFLTGEQMRDIIRSRKTFPPENLGCYQIALTSDGRVYGCCEGTASIGEMDDFIEELGQKLTDRMMMWEKMSHSRKCLGCSSPEFVCGIKDYLPA